MKCKYEKPKALIILYNGKDVITDSVTSPLIPDIDGGDDNHEADD